MEFVYKKPAYYAGVINNSLGLRTLAKFDTCVIDEVIVIPVFAAIISSGSSPESAVSEQAEKTNIIGSNKDIILFFHLFIIGFSP